MKTKREIAVGYVEKEVDLNLLVKAITEKLISTTTPKEVH